MAKSYWNKYFEQEKKICLKYNLETPTSPVIYKKNCFGNIYCEDINIKKVPNRPHSQNHE